MNFDEMSAIKLRNLILFTFTRGDTFLPPVGFAAWVMGRLAERDTLKEIVDKFMDALGKSRIEMKEEASKVKL